MAKGHKHLKKLKSEKAKVKLKGSAKYLPKGTNVTDTNFKVKQIVVREQLKAVNDSELLSKRKLNIKELLTRLQHYNTTVRTDAINDLKQLVTVYPAEIVVPNLCLLIQGVSHLVLDKEKTVRRESLKLVALILSQVSVEQVEPFFDVLSSYFRCAMTHIDPAIQEDSLLLLDTLLQCVPSLVAANSDKILENFFDLISKLRTDSKPGRTLTVNLGSKMTAVKWRIKVLSRLYHMLAAIVNEKERHGQSSKNETTSQIIKFKPDSHNTPVYNNNSIKPCVLKLGNFAKSNTISASEGENNIMKYVDVLVPLLFETWLEVGPNGQKENTKIDVTLTEEAVAVLNSILNIFQLLYTFIKIYEKDVGDYDIANNFITKYGKDFSTFIFSYFPYTQIVSKKRKRNEKLKTVSMESSCIAENLMICHIFCTFHKKLYFHEKKQIENCDKLLAYLQNTFTRWTPENGEQNKHTVLVLKNLLLDVSKTWTSYNDEISNILKLALNLYKQCPNLRPNLFNVLCEIVHYNNLNRVSEFQIWLSTLPNLLCQAEISKKTIDMMSLLARQKNTLFINSLRNKFPEILTNLTKLNITDTDEQDVVKCKIISLVYFIKCDKLFEPIKIFIDVNSDSIFEKYLKEILILKYETTNDQKILNNIKNF